MVVVQWHDRRMETENLSAEVAPVEQVVPKDDEPKGHKVNGFSLVDSSNEEDLTPPSVNGHHSPVQTKKQPAPQVIEVQPTIEVIAEPKAKPKMKEYLDGPDQLIPSEALFNCLPDGAVKLRVGTEGVAAEKPISVPTMLRRTVERYPDRTAMAVKADKNADWTRITFREYEQNVRTVAKAFIKLGLERFHSVNILGFNSPEWFISDLAAIYAGGFAAGIYTTNSAEACLYCAENSRANIIVVEDDKQLKKILQVKSRLPHLKAIIQYSGKVEAEGVLSWADVLKIGEEEKDDELNERIKRIAVNQCCTLVYTSGTTGNPKGVMLSHDNLTWDALAIGSYLQLRTGEEEIVSYLPLSHVAAQVVDLFITISYAATVFFAQPDALKGSLLPTLLEIRPTKFLGVPRVWEKIYEKMQDIGRQSTGIRKTLATWAKSKGLEYNINRMNGNNTPTWGYTFASFLVLKRVRKALGLDRCNLFVSAAAPIASDVVKYFMSLDIPVMEAYGMSEAAGAHTLNTNEFFKIDSVGKTLPGMQTLLFEQDASKQGEICMNGRQVFMGYLNNEEKTKEAMDAQGWLHSGDIGKEDENGFLYITGRIKELLITAGGENVPPVPIEDAIKSELPVVSNAMLIGDRRKFLSILLTLRTETNLDTGEPLDKLTSGARAWCQEQGSSATTLSEIINGPDEKVMKALEAGIVRANKLAISNAQKVQKFKVLPKDFSIPGGELGPTMKVKRNVIHEQYLDLIESFYN
ncbi:long-chain-fatty-acid--CoA ligase ACSBG2 [Neocloeon triangulifer]|uniref:long-chain-fatty-acid--CoA ligase ACSBG2 n=1 Tax=Neocloeon triangulifer TaxID=2078957 RepID=UPI00286FA8D4|nr:long-chain-fatty-acid--CoA ligase ACSBG2 [Neocloeon triangulifer]